MFKKFLKFSSLLLFFVAFVAFLSAPITCIGWLITKKRELNLWFDATLIGLYGALIGVMLHTFFCDEIKIGRRLLLLLCILFCLLISTSFHSRKLFLEPDLFPLLAFWWTALTVGFFFLSFCASNNTARAHNKTSSFAHPDG